MFVVSNNWGAVQNFFSKENVQPFAIPVLVERFTPPPFMPFNKDVIKEVIFAFFLFNV
jgi:hypothetical protein